MSGQKKGIILILLYWGVFCGTFFQLMAQDGYEIRKIVFKGNKSFKKSELLEHLTIHESNFISRKIQRKEPSLYSHEFMVSDIERLTGFYQGKGFLHVQVKLDSLDINNKKQRLNIYISIQENAPILVDSVSIHVNDSLFERNTNQLLRRTNLKKGERFEDQMLYDDIYAINEIFINRGYVYVNTEFNLDLNPDSNKTSISYQVYPGNVCQFEETTITGNKYVKEKVIRKQLAYKSGNTYSRNLLDKTRKQLYDLQLFRVVSLTPQIDKKTRENPIPVQMRIDEMPRITSRFGLGYGTEDKFRAFADITYRALFGGTSRVNLYVKHSALTPYYVSLSWIQPQFFFKKLSVSVNPYARRDDEPGYNIQTLGLNFPVGYIINDKIRTSIAYYLEKVTQHVVDDDFDVPNPEDSEFLYSKSGLSASFVYNSSRPVFSPERGWTVSIGAKINGYIFGTDFDYTRLWVDVRKYQKLGGFVLALRGMAGGIHSSDEGGFIPVEDRFYSGGSNSNRGWSRSRLGTERDDGSPLGGKSILEMNIEIRHHVIWRIEVAAFMDVSNVWTTSYKFPLNDLAYAAGGGIRVNTPIGPIRLDAGVPLWNKKKSMQFFLSVGQAF